MTHITIYSTPTCPYCDRAKELLTRKGQSYQEIDVSNAEERQAMMAKSGGRRTVPQIFIGDQHVGGFDDLAALDRQGKLDEMLK